MSLILVGIDIPKDKKIDIEISPTGLVWVDKGEEYYCLEDLAIQIPKEHGMIIDSHGLIAELTEMLQFLGQQTGTEFKDGYGFGLYTVLCKIARITPILEKENTNEKHKQDINTITSGGMLTISD